MTDRDRQAEDQPNVASGIYQVTNQGNGKRYIGSAVNLGRRQRKHLDRLRRGDHYNFHLQAAFDKYGEATFVFSILEHVTDISRLIEREQHFLDMLSPEYNLRSTAGNMLGYRHSAEARAKIRATHMGHLVSEETRAKIRAVHMGNRLSPGTRAKISAAMSGEQNPMYDKHHNTEARAKMRAARIGKHPSTKTRTKMSVSRSGKRNPMYGKHHSAKTRQKISDALKGKPLSVEHRNKLSEARIGKPHPNKSHPQTMETRLKISKALKGRRLSEEHRRKISEMVKDRCRASTGRFVAMERDHNG